MKIEIESTRSSPPKKKKSPACVCIITYLFEGIGNTTKPEKINSVLSSLIIMYTPKWKLFSWCMNVSLWHCDLLD